MKREEDKITDIKASIVSAAFIIGLTIASIVTAVITLYFAYMLQL